MIINEIKLRQVLRQMLIKNHDHESLINEGKADNAIKKAKLSFVTPQAKSFFDVEIVEYIESELLNYSKTNKSHIFIPIFMSLSTQGGTFQNIDPTSDVYKKHIQDLKHVFPCVLKNADKFGTDKLQNNSNSLKNFYMYVVSVLGRIPNNLSCTPPRAASGSHNTQSYQPVSFTGEELRDIYASFLPRIHKKFEKGKRPSQTGRKSAIIFDSSGIMVVRPETRDASCYFGSRGKWCIARPDNTMFSSYESESPNSRSANRHFYFVKNFDQSISDPTGTTSDVCLQFVHSTSGGRYEGYWSVDDTLHMPSMDDYTKSVPIIDGNNPQAVAIYRNKVRTLDFGTDDYSSGVISISTTPGLVVLINNLRATGLFPGEDKLTPDDGISFQVAISILRNLLGTERFKKAASPENIAALQSDMYTGDSAERKERREIAIAEYEKKKREAIERSKKYISELSDGLIKSDKARINAINALINTEVNGIMQLKNNFDQKISQYNQMFEGINLEGTKIEESPIPSLLSATQTKDYFKTIIDKKIELIQKVHNTPTFEALGGLRDSIKARTDLFSSTLAEMLVKYFQNSNFIEGDVQPLEGLFENIIIEISRYLGEAYLQPDLMVNPIDGVNESDIVLFAGSFAKDIKIFLIDAIEAFITDGCHADLGKDIQAGLASKGFSGSSLGYVAFNGSNFAKIVITEQTNYIDQVISDQDINIAVQNFKEKKLPEKIEQNIQQSSEFLKDLAFRLSQTKLGMGSISDESLVTSNTQQYKANIATKLDIVDFSKYASQYDEISQLIREEYSQKLLLTRVDAMNVKNELAFIAGYQNSNYGFAGLLKLRNKLKKSIKDSNKKVEDFINNSLPTDYAFQRDTHRPAANLDFPGRTMHGNYFFERQVSRSGNSYAIKQGQYKLGKSIDIDLYGRRDPSDIINSNILKFIFSRVKNSVQFGSIQIKYDISIDKPVFPDFPNEPFPIFPTALIQEFQSAHNELMEFEDDRFNEYMVSDYFDNNDPIGEHLPNPIGLHNELAMTLPGQVRFRDIEKISGGSNHELTSDLKEDLIKHITAPESVDDCIIDDVSPEAAYDVYEDEVRQMITGFLSQDKKRIVSSFNGEIDLDITPVILGAFVSKGPDIKDNILAIISNIYDDITKYIEEIIVPFASSGKNPDFSPTKQKEIIDNSRPGAMGGEDWRTDIERDMVKWAEDDGSYWDSSYSDDYDWY